MTIKDYKMNEKVLKILKDEEILDKNVTKERIDELAGKVLKRLKNEHIMDANEIEDLPNEREDTELVPGDPQICFKIGPVRICFPIQ